MEGKRQLFHTEMDAAEHPGRWERKGSQIFRTTTLQRYPEQFRVFRALVRHCRSLGGQLFYYADEKPIETPGQTRLDPTAREAAAMRETLNRIARHAESKATTVLVMLDQITEKTRSERLPNMYGHVYARSTDYPEMKRIVEPPMHVDSALSSTIQFADWVAAFVSRALDYQLLDDSPHGWVVTTKWLDYARGRGDFTHESKLHLHQRSIPDLHRADIFQVNRRLYPKPDGQRVGESIDPAVAEKIRGIADARQRLVPPERTPVRMTVNEAEIAMDPTTRCSGRYGRV